MQKIFVDQSFDFVLGWDPILAANFGADTPSRQNSPSRSVTENAKF